MKRWIKATLVGAVALAPAAAFAAIDNSHHDMKHMSISEEKCAYCHAKTGITAPANYGQTGGFCMVVCHDGATLLTLPEAKPTGPGYFDSTMNLVAGSKTTTGAAVAFTSSHAALKSAIPAPDAAADVTGTNWPHTNKTSMECTSCHAVHDGTNPPFLNAPLATGNNDTAFCNKCHTGSAKVTNYAGRWENITSGGAHPTEFRYSKATALARSGAKSVDTDTAQHARTMDLKATLVRVAPTVPGGGFNANGGHWELGGHFVDTGTKLPVADPDAVTTSVFGCYSCHSAHQDQGGSVGASKLIMAKMDVLCYGCHGKGPTATSTSQENPGNTNFYHPVNTEGKVSPFPVPMSAAFTANLSTGAGTLGSQATAQGLLCVSCHDVHGGVAGKMAIRAIDATKQITDATSVCVACHRASTTNASLTTNFHHPGVNSDYTGAGLGTFAASANWVTKDKLGLLSDGLSCPDCHVFQATKTYRATAHNW